MQKILLILTVIVVSGCSGKLYTIINPTLDANGEEKIQGVLVYNTINVIELYKTTLLIDKSSGNQVGSAPSDCTPEKKIKFSTRTDYAKPNIIVYEPGLFETNKFGVTLDKGTLSGVNTESNPSAALSGIAELIPFIKAPKTTKSLDQAGGKPLCNGSPKLIGIYRAPDIRAFNQLKQ